jgi:lysophospholipase L1-like esterase
MAVSRKVPVAWREIRKDPPPDNKVQPVTRCRIPPGLPGWEESHSAEQTAGVVSAVVQELRKRKPEMKILLLGIFPSSAKATDEIRDKTKSTNSILAKLDDGKMVFFKDVGRAFLEKDGSLSKEVMPDYLHLSPRGYDIWAKAIKDDLRKLLK